MEHPITPSPAAVHQWWRQWDCCPQKRNSNLGSYIANQACHWGWDQRGAATEAELQKAADQELEACCEWISGQDWTWTTAQLRAARRPRLPPETLEVDGHTYQLVK